MAITHEGGSNSEGFGSLLILEAVIAAIGLLLAFLVNPVALLITFFVMLGAGALHEMLTE